jgi:hypothetical protein
MKFEKYKCDGCGKEFATPEAFFIRFAHNNMEKRNPTSAKLESESVAVSVPLGNSLDFCTIDCLELYLTNLKLEQINEGEIPK